MTTPSSEDKTVAEAMDPEEVAIDEFVADYEFYAEDESGAEATHSPTEFERVMIKDAIMGLLADDGYLDARSRLIADTAANAVMERRTALAASGSKGGDEREGLLGDAIRALICGDIKCSDDLPPEKRPVHASARRAFGAVHDLIRAAAPAEQSAAMLEGLEDTEGWEAIASALDDYCAKHPRAYLMQQAVDVIRALAAAQTKGKDDSPSGEADPLDTPLPCRVELGGVSFGKGVALRTLVNAASRWREEAFGPKPTPEEAARALAVLQGTATPQTAAPAAQPEPVAWLGPYESAAEALDALRRAVAETIGADPETWPSHGNAPLAIAAAIAIRHAAYTAAPPPAAQSDEALCKLLNSCREAMQESMRWNPSGTNWTHMIASIDATLAQKGAEHG